MATIDSPASVIGPATKAVIDTFDRYVVPNYRRFPICLVRGQGSRVWDAEGTEYLDLLLSVRVVDNLDAAIEHINTYGSQHTDSIVTRDVARAEEFVARVDSSCVFVNCSTRFSDGGEFGLGAEIGISTEKLHARGPMGLKELTSYKWVAHGSGQIRT